MVNTVIDAHCLCAATQWHAHLQGTIPLHSVMYPMNLVSVMFPEAFFNIMATFVSFAVLQPVQTEPVDLSTRGSNTPPQTPESRSSVLDLSPPRVKREGTVKEFLSLVQYNVCAASEWLCVQTLNEKRSCVSAVILSCLPDRMCMQCSCVQTPSCLFFRRCWARLWGQAPQDQPQSHLIAENHQPSWVSARHLRKTGKWNNHVLADTRKKKRQDGFIGFLSLLWEGLEQDL